MSLVGRRLLGAHTFLSVFLAVSSECCVWIIVELISSCDLWLLRSKVVVNSMAIHNLQHWNRPLNPNGACSNITHSLIQFFICLTKIPWTLCQLFLCIDDFHIFSPHWVCKNSHEKTHSPTHLLYTFPSNRLPMPFGISTLVKRYLLSTQSMPHNFIFHTVQVLSVAFLNDLW